MKLFIVFFLKVDVIHVVADWAFFDVATTVPEVGRHFSLGVLLSTVIAALHKFVLHLFGIYVQK